MEDQSLQKQRALFKRIKRQNGEVFAKAFQRHGLLSVPSLADRLCHAGKINDVEQIIGFLKSLLADQEEFEISYLLQTLETEENTPLNQEIKTALEKQDYQKFVYKLLEKAGYYAYVVDTLEKQNAIKVYFKSDEALCTFDDTSRFLDYRCIHLIKKELIEDENAFRQALEENDYQALTDCFAKAKDKIPRGNPPERQDDYGTSVMSIQLRQGFISIKNRYNHNVSGCDSTFDSDPDKIILGLAMGLKLLFQTDFKKNYLPSNFKKVHAHIVQIYTEKDDILFGHNCYIYGEELVPIDPDYQVIVEEMIIDKRNNTISTPLKMPSLLTQLIAQEFKGKKIHEKKSGTEKVLYADDTPIITFKDGQITHLNLPTAKVLQEGTLANLKELKSLKAPQLTYMESYNIFYCLKLQSVDLPSLERIENNCFYRYYGNVWAPKLLAAGERCFTECHEVNLPKIKKTAGGCFSSCFGKINLPELEEVGRGCFVYCLDRINAPALKKIMITPDEKYLSRNNIHAYEGCFLDTDKRLVHAPFILGQKGNVVAFQQIVNDSNIQKKDSK